MIKSKGRKVDINLENPLDTIFMDIAEILNPIWNKLKLVPNHLTTISLIFGLSSAYYIYNKKYNIATVLYLLAYLFDTCDGNYARTYDMVTSFGDIYDHFSDIIKFIAAMVAMYLTKPKKFINYIPIFIILITAMFINIGCQQKIYNSSNKPIETLDYLRPLCLKQFDISYTRFFGFATFQAIHAYIIWNW